MKSAIAFALALCAASVAMAQPKYVITDLGKIAPATDTVPEGGINNRGEIAGWASRDSPFFVHAFRTPPNGTLSPANDLGTLGGEFGQASAINDLGQVTGHSYGSSTGFAGRRAFRTAVGASTITAADDLGTLGGPFSDGFDINASGQVVGVSRSAFNLVQRAFRTGPNQPINPATDDLGSLIGPSGFSFALAINEIGQVVGFSQSVLPGQTHAFRTAPNSPIAPIDDLGTFGGASSTARGINNSGQVVGQAQLPDGSRRAFRTAPNAPITPADNLGSFGSDSFAWSINNAGDVVGIANTAEGVLKAFLYKDGVLHDLNNAIPSGTAWARLAAGYGINDAGQITGYGFVAGDPVARGFRLDLPGIALNNLASQAGSSGLSAGERQSLSASLDAARSSVERGNRNAARNQLQAFMNKVNALRNSGRIDAATADSWTAAAEMLRSALS